MKHFFYEGEISSSKSLMNRALVVSSFYSNLNLTGFSLCDDVQKMKKATEQFLSGQNLAYDCGAAGTVFRFLSLRLARQPGQHQLTGTPRLFERPHDSLFKILKELKVDFELNSQKLTLRSKGWQWENSIEVDRSQTSQFLSGILLSGWELEKDLTLYWKSTVVSDAYFQMTVELLKNLGMRLDQQQDSITIYKNQKPTTSSYHVESDLSSCFAVATLAALSGEAKFKNFPVQSLQPDFEFIEIMKSMNISADITNHSLTIQRSNDLRPIEWNLVNCPDLFPVLCVLCAFVPGTSHLKGAPHLVHKESNRILKSAELIKKIHRDCEVTSDGIIIHGKSEREFTPFEFDTDHDHRMAFAAGICQYLGAPITIHHPEVVNKSFPEFWKILESV
ncbi:MAG: 3-phosphoshikimate 1-carboxyvinyltransferase [Bdellovibrionales bacterium]|nr:3-phosphoshikimate 1-carboxyvinyltransferase [Bdellovibrionales bacterium]